MGPLQKKWIEALESGQYNQGQGYLKRENSDGQICYCCLGVACEIAGLSNFLNDNGIYCFRDLNGASSCEIPTPNGDRNEINFLGLHTSVGKIERGIGSLANMNDHGCTFMQIAKFIRENEKSIFAREV